MSYVYDQVLSPPSDILDLPLDDPDFGIGHGTSEAESLSFFFRYLDLTAGVRYRVLKSPNFLCLDWVRHRIRDDLVDGGSFPEGDETTDLAGYTLRQIEGVIRNWGMVPCYDDDDDRLILVWAIGEPSPGSRVGHIQVRRLDEDIWESKVARAPWVITHAEDDYQYYKGGNLVKARYFKRAT
ncbi:hypothetical protein M407DRAFT_242912 [Tulasnella calospora MUT 4182]|uniref:Uncharacterized protein n=1 Tax=Tulasnella calospora MUT 4182 TaxID=1051891 RepID=A0A0C3M4V1_9AGAM|nr:hypothetical protein M407DRAFT_242912 [Tulasnella calospora MUT 4182]